MDTSQSAQHLKVNLKVAGHACRRCSDALQLATDATICNGCGAEHHRRCWDDAGGCATRGCINAPLARIEASPVARPVAHDMMRCYSCNGEIASASQFCPLCGQVTSPDGIYHGPTVNAPGAVASLVYGIIGLLVCGIIFGPVAISKSNSAKRAIASNPTYGGSGYATAGMVLGVLDIVFTVVILIAKLGAAGGQ